jgi:polyphosphate kinase
VSENIRVVSIVDKFLEHSRIFYFENDGDPEIFLASADWMPRNFFRRIEVMFPVIDPALKARIMEEILDIVLADNVKARVLRQDGAYVRVERERDEAPVRSQLVLQGLARRSARTASGAGGPFRTLTPRRLSGADRQPSEV